MRCIKCWDRKPIDPIYIADDFEGCFCQDCYEENPETVDHFITLLSDLCAAEDDSGAMATYDELTACIDVLELCPEGRSAVLDYLGGKTVGVMSEIDEERDAEARKESLTQQQARQVEMAVHRRQLRREFLAVTSHSIEGYRIVNYHGIVTGASVMGTGLRSSARAAWADLLGIESSSFTAKLEEAKDNAMSYAIDHAIAAGGNAMIAVDVDFSMFSSDMIGAVVTGTAVTIEKATDETRKGT